MTVGTTSRSASSTRRAARAEVRERVGARPRAGRDDDDAPSASRTSCPAGSSNGSRWPAPWCSSRQSCCSTSPSARSTPNCARPLQIELRQLQKRVETTFVYVTHDQEEAMTMSDRLAVLLDGRIEQLGIAERGLLATGQTSYVAGFLGSANLYDVTVIDVAADETHVPSSGRSRSARPPPTARCRARPSASRSDPSGSRSRRPTSCARTAMANVFARHGRARRVPRGADPRRRADRRRAPGGRGAPTSTASFPTGCARARPVCARISVKAISTAAAQRRADHARRRPRPSAPCAVRPGLSRRQLRAPARRSASRCRTRPLGRPSRLGARPGSTARRAGRPT